jgi:UPF0271 protein
VDLNADLGEGPGEEALYALVTSANIACGGHAGTIDAMNAALDLCAAHGVAAGAHPSYPDRDGFGRRPQAIAVADLARTVALQVDLLSRLARARGVRLSHVKPHGALYNDAARDEAVARSVAEGVGRVGGDLVLVGLAGSPGLDLWRSVGFRVAREGFADRAYRADGTLVARDRPDAVIVDPDAAANQAVRLASAGACDTLCVHGDTPGATVVLAAVRGALLAAGFVIRALVPAADRP